MDKFSTSKQGIKAIILAGSYGFRSCPLEKHIPMVLWPIAGKPVITRLLTSLAEQGIKQAVICANDNSSLQKQSIDIDDRLQLAFWDEPLPTGSAGCIREAVNTQSDDILLVLSANIVCLPSIDALIKTHRGSKSDLTVTFNPSHKKTPQMDKAAEIYICETSILEHIPEQGYFDIKEGLIPEILRAGKTVHALTLSNHARNFQNQQEYLCALADYLVNGDKTNDELQILEKNHLRTIWAGPKTTIDPEAQIYGPVAIMRNACVEKGTVVLGPTLLGCNVNIGQNSIVAHSVLWDNAKVGYNCEIKRCVFGYDAVLQNNTIVEEKTIPYKPEKIIDRLPGKALTIMRNDTSKLWLALQMLLDKVNEKLPNYLQLHRKKIAPYLASVLLLIALLWSYWPGLIDVWNIWQRSDEYSSGLLVPFLAVYILWSRRHKIAQASIKPSIWGLFAFVAAQAFRFFGLFFMYGSAERLSIVLSIVALVLLLFGWQFLRKVSTILLFLFLMLPWPNRVQAAVAIPLQSWATSSAVFCLEIIGYEVIQEGNIIHIGQATVAVAEACNGLRMITAFFVIIGLVVLLVKRAWWEKLFLLASCLPIAFLCNTVRLAITAIAFTILKGGQWEKIFHDFGGYAMMPLALAVAVAELWFLTKLTTPPVKKEMVIIRQKKR